MLNDNGLRHGAAGSIHMLADIVAWANNRGVEPKGVTTMDCSGMDKGAVRKKIG